jgi:glycosyltransferase involved in cell wall biosynthesis
LHFELNLFLFSKKSLPRPDVIVVSSLSILTILNGLYLKQKYKCRFVLEIRDIWPLTLVEEGGFSECNPFVLLLSFLEKLGYRQADLIIGTMPNLEQHVREVSASTSDVVCVPMGVSESQFNQKSWLDQAYKDKYLSSSKFKVVHAGTVGITNALETFFEAANLLRSNQSVEFVLVGDGALLKHFKSLYGGLPNLVFAPKVPRQTVQAVLSECDVVYFSAYPSKVWTYGQSLNKIIDYMLSGKPVIGSYGGYPSMINEANCGVFVPPGDPRALADEVVKFSKMSRQQLTEIGNRGRSWLLVNRNYKSLSADFAEAIFRGL